MKNLSTGMPSNLGSYLKLTEIFFGEGSTQHKFIKAKIDASENGAKEEVIAAESQMLALLGSMK